MPRHNYTHGFTRGSHRTRKRVCSSSSSSSVLQNYSLKKAVLIRNPKSRSRSTTPAPSWKIPCARSPSYSLSPLASSSSTPPLHMSKQKVVPPASARKLAATLWEINEIPPHPRTDKFDHRKVVKRREKWERSNQFPWLPQNLYHPSHSTASEKMDRPMMSNDRGEPSVLQKHRILDDFSDDAGFLDSASNASLMELGSENPSRSGSNSILLCSRNHLKEAGGAVVTSIELLEIIDRVRGSRGRHQPCATLFSALHTELERARLLINRATHEGSSKKTEAHLLRHLAAERETVEAAMDSAVAELEAERRRRRRAESLSKKLGRELQILRGSRTRFLEAENTDMVAESFERCPSEVHEDIVYDRGSLLLPFSRTEVSRSNQAEGWEEDGCGMWSGRVQPPASEEREEAGKVEGVPRLKKGLKEQLFSRLGTSGIFQNRRSLSAMHE